MKPNLVERDTGILSGIFPMSHPVNSPTRKAGFVAGTTLYTRDGEMPVEFLSPGDCLITKDAGFVKLTGIVHRRTLSYAISIAAGSLGHTRPDHDIILHAAQMVLIRDWRAQAMFGTDQAMVRADALVDGEFVLNLGVRKMHLLHLEFESPHILYAGGLELSCMSSSTQTLQDAA